MARTLQTMLDERAGALVGRERERAALLELVDHDAPIVVAVHGIAGVGKSTLLQAAAVDARERGATVVRLDGGTFEPTPRGFTEALGDALDGHPGRVLLAIDSYERLRLLDAWLRQSFVPSLPDNVRLLIAGRDLPTAWQRDLGDLLRLVRLDNLSDEGALELLRRSGLPDATAARVARLARGHPLSLRLAAGVLAERPGLPAEDAVLGPMVEELAGVYIDGLDATTRRALDAASVVRRTTLTLIEAMLPGDDPTDLFARLRALPFVELGTEGLFVHDTVRSATSALLQASDPARHRAHRSAAWGRLRAELRTAGRADLWRYTADMLYLVENPIVRDAFFPSGADEYVIDPATPADLGPILAISRRHDDPEATALVAAWWQGVPEAFRVVRDGAGEVQGFCCLCQPRDVPRALLAADPVADAWREHLRREPVPAGQRVLVNRFSLVAESGEAPSAASATLWLDTKRAYLELRPDLRRLYVPVTNVEPALAALAPLGFGTIDGRPVAVGASSYSLLANDFGPGSIDGWLSDVVGRELQTDAPGVVDAEGRRLVLDGKAVDLSRLELGVLRHLQSRPGVAVTREELLREVWGHQWTGSSSNVVEVVVSSLRKKLGDRAAALDTVRGVGYRLDTLD